jgi:1,4-dihydroxy-2-naphthoyl-CoA synthase
VNSLLSLCDSDTPLDGLLPHANTLCVIRYITQEAHNGIQAFKEERPPSPEMANTKASASIEMAHRA